MTEQTSDTMRAVLYHETGEPSEILKLETVPVPVPGPDGVRVKVLACGLAPADWAVCRGLFPGELPRGIGCDVSGAVDAIGENVTDVAIGDLVFGTTAWATSSSAGAADQVIMDHYFAIPDGLDPDDAAALPMALDSADVHLSALGVGPGQTILIHGAGSTVGYAAVQIALARGASVIATAGDTYAQPLRDLGAEVTPYGDGMVQRVQAISDGPVDFVLDTAPVGGALPDLVTIAGGDPKRVLTISDFAAAAELGVRDTFHEDLTGYERYGAFPEFAQRAAEGRLRVPIARTFPLEQWREALEISLGRQPRGKLLLIPGDSAANN